MKKAQIKYQIVRDNQEKETKWDFPPSANCNGTTEESLDTGDYTIRGLEDIFIIERKFSTGEFSGNLPAKRFERELQRMEKFKHKFIICEFLLEDLFQFPYNSGIPNKIWPKLRVHSGFLLKKLIELECQFGCKFIFAGTRGKEMARLLFKRMVELYPDKIQ
jgi:hypothetical protein